MGGGGVMPRKRKLYKRKKKVLWGFLAAGVILLLAAVWFNRYVNRVIKPTLHLLAEYQARSLTVQVMNTVVAEEMQENSALYQDLYNFTLDREGHVIGVAANASALNTAQSRLVRAVEDALRELPEKSWTIPFGTLTNNSLLSGLGPGWRISLCPQGYVEGTVRQDITEAAINCTQYSATLVLQVTVNMALDSSVATLTVTNEVPLASILLNGETPDVYAANAD